MKKTIAILGMMLMAMMFISPVSAQDKIKAKKNYEEVQIQTSAVCGMCKERIETNIAYEKGVKKVELNNDTKIVTIGFDPRKNNPDNLRTALSNLGYDADSVPANKEAYDKLPACCKKGNAKH
jgi:periplasmic mercuric ion binding protein